MIVYKIRHKITGLYSRGGSPAGWNKIGKVWSAIGHMKNHLLMLRNWKTKELLPVALDWEVVVLEVKESEVKTISIEDFLKKGIKP